MTTAADSLTVLTSVNRALASKTFSRGKDGSIKNKSYGNAKHFAVATLDVDGIVGLGRALDQISRNRYAFVVRGAPLPGIDLKHARRLLHPDKKTGEPATLAEVPRHWFLVDGDEVPCPAAIEPLSDPEAAVEHVIGLLPSELHDAWCWWQFSAQQSVYPDQQTIRLHLWFWCELALAGAELTRWAIKANEAAGRKLIDPAVFRAAQPHYLALPDFVAPLADPLPRRCGLRRGLDEAVSLVIPPPHPKRPVEPGATGYAPGRGVSAYLAMIGSPTGFRAPIVKAIASYVGSWGSAADCTDLKTEIRKAIDHADPGGRSADELERYKSDKHLDAIIDAIRGFQGDTPGRGLAPVEPPPTELPIIRIVSGLRHQAADQGLAALHTAGVAFYQRNRSLVRVCPIKAKAADGAIIQVPGIVRVTPALLGRVLGQSAYWEKVPEKGPAWRVDPPGGVVEQILEMVEQWPFPPLAGVITCPTLRPDGSLLDREGYDPPTGLVLYQTIALPPIRETDADARAAVRLLDGLLDDFPFANNESRSVALSKILTPVLRGAFPLAPLHLTSSPEAGSGKSYLDDIAAAIATGERCAVIAVSPNTEETEKRLIGAVLGGHPIITLDNVRIVLEGDFLCQMTERPLLQLRPLGTSDEIRVANTFTVFANGNNIIVADDVVRRSIRCGIDAESETPETRTFSKNPRAMVLANRGDHIAAALTIGRAYIAAGRPLLPPPLPSYEGWSALVRGALIWLGYRDPVVTMDDIRGADPVRQDRASVFAAWREELKVGTEYLAAEIAEHAEARYDYDHSLVRPKLHAALLAVASKRGRGDEVDPRRLGIWLKKNENTIVDRLKLTVDRSDATRPHWQLKPI